MINKDSIYMNVCMNMSEFSKCQFTKVACIFVNESGKVISTGVNGTLSGMENCCDHHFEKREDHKPYSDENEIHAEMNAILDLARNGTRFNTISVYTTISPCENCLKHLLGLIQVGLVSIDKIVYGEKYHRLTDEQVDKMKEKCAKLGVEFYEQ